MKKIVFLGLFMFFAKSALAQNTYLQGVFGFEQSAINLGLDYEFKDSGESLGYGGYLMYSSEEEGVNSQLISIGAMAKLHFYENSKFDLSVGPGFGLAMVEAGSTDETTIGPMVKFGMLYKHSAKTAIGFEIFKQYNWLSDELASGVEYFSLAFRIAL